MLAVRRDYPALVRLLLGVPGIDVNQTRPNGSTALIDAARSGRSSLLPILTSFPGIDVNWADGGGESAVGRGAMYGRNATVLLLLHIGAAVGEAEVKTA